jgi:flagellar biosynthesis/type III secretory pathway protein FliH
LVATTCNGFTTCLFGCFSSFFLRLFAQATKQKMQVTIAPEIPMKMGKNIAEVSVSSIDGMEEGIADGIAEGISEGELEGSPDGKEEGFSEGETDGAPEGEEEGFSDGEEEGLSDGEEEGSPDGSCEIDGADDGSPDGKEEGLSDGEAEGLSEGEAEVAGHFFCFHWRAPRIINSFPIPSPVSFRGFN